MILWYLDGGFTDKGTAKNYKNKNALGFLSGIAPASHAHMTVLSSYSQRFKRWHCVDMWGLVFGVWFSLIVFHYIYTYMHAEIYRVEAPVRASVKMVLSGLIRAIKLAVCCFLGTPCASSYYSTMRRCSRAIVSVLSLRFLSCDPLVFLHVIGDIMDI